MNEVNKIKALGLVKSTLDTLPFTKFHLHILLGLGISWVIDGYEVSLLSILTGVLKEQLNMTDVEIAQAGSMYLIGCVSGAIIFAYLSNKYGRKKLFSTTIIIYMISILITAGSLNRMMFYFGRFLTGLSIGGEYTAIFAAIDELIQLVIEELLIY
jgi:MFS family permease